MVIVRDKRKCIMCKAKRPLHCSDCVTNNMINVVNKLCKYGKVLCYNLPTKKEYPNSLYINIFIKIEFMLR